MTETTMGMYLLQCAVGAQRQYHEAALSIFLMIVLAH